MKLLDKLLHSMAEKEGQQVVLISQVLAAECNIGYEEIQNTQARRDSPRSIWEATFQGWPGGKERALMIHRCWR